MEVFLACADNEGGQIAKMVIKPTVDFLLIGGKQYTTVHLDKA